MAVSGTGDRATAAREIRRVITEYRDSHTMMTVFGAMAPLATLLWGYETPTAYLLLLPPDECGPPPPADALDAATITELDARAAVMDADETVALALDALDRYLAAIEPD